MKITKQQLQQIIKEEIDAILEYGAVAPGNLNRDKTEYVDPEDDRVRYGQRGRNKNTSPEGGFVREATGYELEDPEEEAELQKYEWLLTSVFRYLVRPRKFFTFNRVKLFLQA